MRMIGSVSGVNPNIQITKFAGRLHFGYQRQITFWISTADYILDINGRLHFGYQRQITFWISTADSSSHLPDIFNITFWFSGETYLIF
jgi:hypothetical protein